MYRNVLTPAKEITHHTKSIAVISVVPTPILHFLLTEIAFGAKKIITDAAIRNSHRHISQAKLNFITGVTFMTYHSSSS